MTLAPEDRALVRSLVEHYRTSPVEPEPQVNGTPKKTKPKPFRKVFWRRCLLCGEPAWGAYCHSHDFAYGLEEGVK